MTVSSRIRRLGACLALALAPWAAGAQQPKLADYGQLPLAFEPGAQGQYVARGPGYTLVLSGPEAELRLDQGRVFKLRLEGAGPVAAVGARKLASVTNEYFGNDPRLWRTNIANYAEVEFSDIYPGIGLRYYGRQGKLESDFTLAPGADPAAIRLGISGASKLRLDHDGNLVMTLAQGSVTLGRPNVYQTVNGERRAVAAGYRLRGREARFTLGAYDRSLPLVIDPTLSYSYNATGGYSTLLGANVIPTPPGPALGVNAAGEAVLIGLTLDATFPTLNAFDATCASGVTAGSCTNQDVFVTKFNAAGTGLVYSTYFGGNEGENHITGTVDASGNAYVAGSTFMTTGATFPIVGSVVQPAPASPSQYFLAKFNSSGQVVYSTFLGSEFMVINAVAADSAGNAYVTGEDIIGDASLPLFNPVPVACPGGSCTEAFVAELNPSGSQYLYSTYFGGGVSNQGTIANAIAVDHAGDIDIGGSTTATDLPAVQALQSSCTISFETCGFVTELNPALSGASEIVFSTFLGEAAAVNSLAADGATPANLYAVGTAITGVVNASLPATPGAFESVPGFGLENPGETTFVAKIPTGAPATPAYITYLGGSIEDLPAAIAADGSGDAWIGGTAQSRDFPILNPIGSCPSGNGTTNCDAGFVSELNPEGTALLFSTFIGGSSGGDQVTGIALDGAGSVYAGGLANSVNFPFTSGAYQRACASNGTACLSESGFVAKLAPQTAPAAPAVAVSSPGFSQGFVGFRNTAVITVTNTAASGQDLAVTGTASDGEPNFDFTANATLAGTGTGNPACMANSTTPNPVPPGGSCDITVTWDPSQTGPDTGTVEIFDNAANMASPQPVFFSGNAINGGQAAVAPSPANFGDVVQGRQGVETVTVTNTGNQSLTMGSIGVTGASDFALGTQLTTGCTSGESLSRAFGSTSPGGSCTITVVYNANGTFNVPETGTLTINDTSVSPPGTVQTVNLNATTEQAEPAIVVNPTAGLRFGAVAENAPSGQLQVEITNSGPGALSISGIAPAGPNAGDFHIASQSAACASAITFEQCFVDIYFQPTVTGPESATLQISSNDPVTPTLNLALSGSGAAAPGPPVGLPFEIALNNAVPPAEANNGTVASAVSSGGQFVTFTGGNNSFSGGPSSNMPGPSASVQGVSGLYLRNTCNGAPGTCGQSTQFIAYGPVSGLESNGGAACLNFQQTQTQGATNPHISSDGRFVAFNDDACPPTSANAPQTEPGPIFLRDTQANSGAGSTSAVTDASANPLTGFFAMSGDARFFAYSTPPSAPGGVSISETDTVAPSNVLVSQSNKGTPDPGTSLSPPSISPDGRYVAFASNFDDVNASGATASSEVYLRDTCLDATGPCTPGTTLVSADSSGNPGTGGGSGQAANRGGSSFPGIAVSSGGRYVVFTSNAQNLPQPPNRLGTDPFPAEVYLRDTVAGKTTLLSAADGGTTPAGDSIGPLISNDGRIITFIAEAPLIGSAPSNALYEYDTCVSNGVAVGGGCVAGLKGVISETLAGTTLSNVPVSSFAAALDPTGAFATYDTPPSGCTSCSQIWENSAAATAPVGVTVPIVSLTPSTTAPGPGQTVTFTATVENTGSNIATENNNATDVIVSDAISSNAAFGTLPSNCTPASGTIVNCDLGPLGVGTSASVAIPVTAPNTPGASLTNSASVSAGTQSDLATQTSLSSTVTVPAPPSITTATLPGGIAGQSYVVAVNTNGGTPPITLSLASGSLPPGVVPVAGGLAGTPTTAGTYSFVLQATDSLNQTSAPVSYTVVIGCPSIGLTAIYAVAAAGSPPPPVPTTLAETMGLPIAAIQFAAVEALGTNLPVTFSANGNLDGLNFDTTKADLSGTPTAAGTFPFTINATGGGCSATGDSFTLVVSAPSSQTLPTIIETIHVTDNPLGAPNTLISANVIPPIPEAITVSDNPLGAPNTLISANVIPTINEGITVTDTPAPTACAVVPGIAVQAAAFLPKFGTTTYRQAVRLMNTGSAAITGPIYFVLDGLTGGTLQGAAGTTSCTSPAGSPYQVATSSGLAPGASIIITVSVTKTSPPTAGITYIPRVLAGGKP